MILKTNLRIAQILVAAAFANIVACRKDKVEVKVDGVSASVGSSSPVPRLVVTNACSYDIWIEQDLHRSRRYGS